jgi:hypothetical protein
MTRNSVPSGAAPKSNTFTTCAVRSAATAAASRWNRWRADSAVATAGFITLIATRPFVSGLIAR